MFLEIAEQKRLVPKNEYSNIIINYVSVAAFSESNRKNKKL